VPCEHPRASREGGELRGGWGGGEEDYLGEGVERSKLRWQMR